MYDWRKMKKILIVIPVFNDWDSLSKLLTETNNFMKDINNIDFGCLIINDASTIKSPKIIKPSNYSFLTIINMRKNRGAARCIAFGIKHLSSEKKDFDHLILMDGDGEDRPEEIKSLVKKALNDESISVVAKRIKRSEGILFQVLYQMHKLLTFIFTGKNINFGNYSCITKKDVNYLATKGSLWSSYSGSVKFHIKKLNNIDSIRGNRYAGDSKMTLLKLILHSFSIIAVFKRKVFIRSAIFIFLISIFFKDINSISIFFSMLLVTFNLVIFIVSKRENEQELKDSYKNIDNINNITH